MMCEEEMQVWIQKIIVQKEEWIEKMNVDHNCNRWMDGLSCNLDWI